MRYLLVLVLLLVGCTPTATPSSSPSGPSSATPEPSPTCSPVGEKARPCTPEEYADVEEQNRLIAQAEAVYRRFWKEDVRLHRAGGAGKATPVLKQTLEGEALSSVMEILRELKKNGAKAVGGKFEIVWIRPNLGKVKADSVVSLSVCWRTPNVWLKLPGGGRFDNESTVKEDSFYRKSGDSLKIFSFESKEVQTC